jgi:hypothetical protein
MLLGTFIFLCINGVLWFLRNRIAPGWLILFASLNGVLTTALDYARAAG